jgi:GTP diphosphokinase / guanosine-3',5'-bis(diphosphate) 3'-diphosphatase
LGGVKQNGGLSLPRAHFQLSTFNSQLSPRIAHRASLSHPPPTANLSVRIANRASLSHPSRTGSRQNLSVATLERAVEIAAKAHAGQVDKAGAPYLLHPLRLMLKMRGPDARIAAVLHDVVEDTGLTFERLEAEGFSQEVLYAVRLLTHDPAEDYFAYLERLKSNRIAHEVKLADLEDNLDLSRIANPTERDHARLEKYERAKAILAEP